MYISKLVPPGSSHCSIIFILPPDNNVVSASLDVCCGYVHCTMNEPIFDSNRDKEPQLQICWLYLNVS